MKKVMRCAAQGDVMFRRVEQVPDGVTEVPRETDGSIVVTHSESGHHHAIGADFDARMFSKGDPLVCYLSVNDPFVDVEHLRPYDTHETLRLPAGIWEVRRQREHTPSGWRRVED